MAVDTMPPTIDRRPIMGVHAHFRAAVSGPWFTTVRRRAIIFPSSYSTSAVMPVHGHPYSSPPKKIYYNIIILYYNYISPTSASTIRGRVYDRLERITELEKEPDKSG